jgi:hypothetical protein
VHGTQVEILLETIPTAMSNNVTASSGFYGLEYGLVNGITMSKVHTEIIQAAFASDNDFCGPWQHLAIASFVRHAKLILSPADFESDVGKWTFAFASDPALGKREIASKNEVALLWIKAEMVNAFDTALRVNNDFSTMCLDWFEPGEINHVRHMAGIPESVFLVAMACGFTLHWPSMLDRGNIGFIRYGSAHNLTEEQYFSTFLAFGSSVAARLGSRCGPGCTAEKGRQVFARVLFRRLSPRMTEICLAVQELGLPALVLCEILDQSWHRLSLLIPMHFKWQLVTKIKHFR